MVNIKEVIKEEKRKERELFKKRENELFLHLRDALNTINELIDFMIVDEGAYSIHSDCVRLETDGCVNTDSQLMKALSGILFNRLEKTNRIKNLMGLTVDLYPRTLSSNSVLAHKRDKTKYTVTRLTFNDERFDGNTYNVEIEVKRHKHKFTNIKLRVLYDYTYIELQ